MEMPVKSSQVKSSQVKSSQVKSSGNPKRGWWLDYKVAASE